ncbi:UPF0481 protein At3g47200-like [Miscanthus floridulus]|uniref:UPF0481 protein At3g47200-like n=1 Tax=Miscanthus floridulus TaxID=154761 RepID=UPI00345AFB53
MNGVLLPKYGTDESEQPPTIYTVPQEIKGGNEDAYLPFAVKIGPLTRYRNRMGHYDQYDRLQDYKWCCVRRLIGRNHLLQEPERTPVLLDRCLNSLRSLEPRIRASYQNTDNINEQDMLLDGCFILHRLLKYAHIAKREEALEVKASTAKDEEEEDDDWTQVFGRCWVWGFVTYDLLLLENQIPFLVVQSLFHDLRTDPDESSDVLVLGAQRLFRSLRPQPLQSSHIACSSVHHLLHLFYQSVGLPAATPKPDNLRRYRMPPSELSEWMPCATELEEAGVKIRARQGASSFLDVGFDAGFLEIPMLQLYDYSEQLLRNLIAFEQTYPLTPGHVTAYAMLMDCLVASSEDMRLLQLRGVLMNQMNGVRDKDQTGFFSRLCHGVHIAADRNYLGGVIEEVNKYQQARWPRWRAALVRNYFSNPWVATSLAAAVFLLALTIMQTFFAAYSYFKPPH